MAFAIEALDAETGSTMVPVSAAISFRASRSLVSAIASNIRSPSNVTGITCKRRATSPSSVAYAIGSRVCAVSSILRMASAPAACLDDDTKYLLDARDAGECLPHPILPQRTHAFGDGVLLDVFG